MTQRRTCSRVTRPLSGSSSLFEPPFEFFFINFSLSTISLSSTDNANSLLHQSSVNDYQYPKPFGESDCLLSSLLVRMPLVFDCDGERIFQNTSRFLKRNAMLSAV